VLENRVARLEAELGVPAEGGDDGMVPVSAEERLAGHRAMVEMLRGLHSEEQIAELEREFVPGPKWQRRLSPAAFEQIAMTLATRSVSASVEVQSDDACRPLAP
jgi:hypothetical protein